MTYPNRIIISIFATTKCNRFCLHCMTNSDMANPIDFTPEKTEKLLKTIKKAGIKAIISISGGGEPLMNEELPIIVKKICDSPLVEKCMLVTSGFLGNETEEKRLTKVIRTNDKTKFSVNLSFHRFNWQYRERFEETFKFLLNCNLHTFVIKTTVAKSDDIHDQLEDFFEKYRVYPFLIHPEIWQFLKTRLFESKIYSYDQEYQLIGLSEFAKCYYAYPKKPKWVVVTTQMLTPDGRAKNHLKKEAFSRRPCCRTLFQKGYSSHFIIDADGSFYPGCCNPKNNPHMIIGRTDDGIKKMIGVNRALSKSLLTGIFLDKRNDNNICSLCAKIKAEQDARA